MAKNSIRYGVSLRKRFRAVVKEKHSKYKCEICGKTAVKRISAGIWHCKYCNATFAGGAYQLKTAVGEAVKLALAQVKQVE